MRATSGQIGRYASFVVWFFRDALLRYRRRLALVVVANMIGVALQGLAVLIAYRYASAVETGKTIDAVGLSVDPRQSLGLLAATAVTVFVLSATSAALIMFGRVAGAKMAFDYADDCSQRIFFLVSNLPIRAESEVNTQLTKQRVMELTRRDPSYCGQVLRIVLYALLHVATVAVAAAALIYLDVSLTLIIFAILAIAVVFLRRVSIRGASQRAKLMGFALDKSKDLRGLTNRVLNNPAPLARGDSALVDPFAEGAAATFRRTLVGQRQALEGGKLIAQIAIGASLFVVLLVQGGASVLHGGNWSSLLAYIAALSFLGGSMVRVGRMLVSINRFYPPLARHARFVEEAERDIRMDRRQPATDGAGWSLDAPRLDTGVPRELQMRPGDRVALALPDNLSRSSIIAPARTLRSSRHDASSAFMLPWFVSSGTLLTSGTLRQNLGLAKACSADEFQKALHLLDPETAGKVPLELDRPLTTAERERLPAQATFTLVALAGILNRCPVLVLDANGLAALQPAVRDRLVKQAASLLTLVAYAAGKAELLGGYGESTVIIATSDEVLGWSSIEAVRAGDEAAKRAIARAAADARKARVAVLEEEEMEELE